MMSTITKEQRRRVREIAAQTGERPTCVAETGGRLYLAHSHTTGQVDVWTRAGREPAGRVRIVSAANAADSAPKYWVESGKVYKIAPANRGEEVYWQHALPRLHERMPDIAPLADREGVHKLDVGAEVLVLPQGSALLR